jgi:hypothetical protein
MGKKYYPYVCEKCGNKGMSNELAGGTPIADTGDYDDCYCPVCGSTSINDRCDEVGCKDCPSYPCSYSYHYQKIKKSSLTL